MALLGSSFEKKLGLSYSSYLFLIFVSALILILVTYLLAGQSIKNYFSSYFKKRATASQGNRTLLIVLSVLGLVVLVAVIAYFILKSYFPETWNKILTFFNLESPETDESPAPAGSKHRVAKPLPYGIPKHVRDMSCLLAYDKELNSEKDQLQGTLNKLTQGTNGHKSALDSTDAHVKRDLQAIADQNKSYNTEWNAITHGTGDYAKGAGTHSGQSDAQYQSRIRAAELTAKNTHRTTLLGLDQTLGKDKFDQRLLHKEVDYLKAQKDYLDSKIRYLHYLYGNKLDNYQPPTQCRGVVQKVNAQCPRRGPSMQEGCNRGSQHDGRGPHNCGLCQASQQGYTPSSK